MWCDTCIKGNMKKSRKAGLVNSSRRILSCKKNLNDSKTSENIANYFGKTESVQEIKDFPKSSVQFSDSLEISDSESPYQNLLTEIKPVLNDSACEKNDFKTAEPFKLVSKAGVAKKLPNIKTQKAKQPKQNTMVKLMEKKLCNGDTNGDHLQLALVLSKSMQKEEDQPTTYCGMRGNTILEQFGFSSGRKLNAEKKIISNDGFKKRKKSRYQYITPALFSRQNDDRERIIATKISLILSQNNRTNVNICEQQLISLSSPYLQQFNKSGIYKLNQLTHEELQNKDMFYLNNPKVRQSTCTSGYLLKDWNNIFGRETTPSRDVQPFLKESISTSYNQQLESNKENNEIHSEREEEYETKSTTTSTSKVTNICMSPDLFDSDNDSVMSDLNKSINEQLEFSQWLIKNFNLKSNSFNNYSPSETDDNYKEKQIVYNNFEPSTDIIKCPEYKSQNGIFHFENFHEAHVHCRLINESHPVDAVALNVSKSAALQGIKNLASVKNSINTSACNISHICEKISVQNDTSEKDFRDLKCFRQESEAHNNVVQKTAEPSTSQDVKKLYDFYDLTNSSDDESIISYIPTVKTSSKSKFESKKDSSVLHILNNFSMEVLKISKKVEKVSDSEKSDSTDCELEIYSRIHNERNDTIRSSFSSHSISNILKSESKEKCTQEIINVSDAELPVKTITSNNCGGSFKNTSFFSESDEKLSRDSTLSDINSNSSVSVTPPKNYTLISESDINLSQQSNYLSDKVFQNKMNLSTVPINENSGRNCNNINSFSSTSDDNLSQESICISDEELNYSCMYSKSANKSISLGNLCESPSNGNLSECNILAATEITKSSVCVTEFLEKDNTYVNENKYNVNNYINFDINTDIPADVRVSFQTENVLTYKTPENKCNKSHNNNFILKSKDITPMPNYTEMDTPGITEKLQKYGIKNLKRRRGVDILRYIYDSTHPLIPEQEMGNINDDDTKLVKKRKRHDLRKSKKKLNSKFNEKNKIREENASLKSKCSIKLIGDLLQENENDLIIEKKQSTKVSSCQVPLHIAWHNLVASHPGIKENILLYEPLQLEVLYSLLKEQGYTYSMQDLLTFLDKKCITIRTNQSRRKTKQNILTGLSS